MGVSANQALRDYKAQGGRVRRQSFLDAWRETNASFESGAKHGIDPRSLQLHRRPLPEHITNYDADRQRPKGYLYVFDMLVRESRSQRVMRKAWGVRSNRLISWRRAIERAIEEFNVAMEGSEGWTLVAVIPVEVRRFV